MVIQENIKVCTIDFLWFAPHFIAIHPIVVDTLYLNHKSHGGARGNTRRSPVRGIHPLRTSMSLLNYQQISPLNVEIFHRIHQGIIKVIRIHLLPTVNAHNKTLYHYINNKPIATHLMTLWLLYTHAGTHCQFLRHAQAMHLWPLAVTFSSPWMPLWESHLLSSALLSKWNVTCVWKSTSCIVLAVGKSAVWWKCLRNPQY